LGPALPFLCHCRDCTTRFGRHGNKPPHSRHANSGRGVTLVTTLTDSPALKVQVMCEGIRYTEALGRAALHSMPNYYPYRFQPGEHDPTGKGIATVPYLINTTDGTEVRI